MKKRFLAILTAVCMLALMLPLGIFPASAEVYGGTSEDGLTWSYNTANATLTIDGDGAMADYSYSLQTLRTNAPWDAYAGLTLSLVIGDGVTYIGDYAFFGFILLNSVTFGNGVTSIGDHAFTECRVLVSVTLPENLESIGKDAFRGCSFASVTVPYGVTEIGDGAFRNCWTLNTLILPDSVTGIGANAFGGAYGLYAIYFAGSRTTWSGVSVDSGNNGLTVSQMKFATDAPTYTIEGHVLTLDTFPWCEYSCDGGEHWQASPVFDNLVAGETYVFVRRVAATDKHPAGEISESLVLVFKYAADAPADPVVEEITPTSVTLKTVPGCEYAIDGKAWQASPVFTDLTPGSEHIFSQRFAETATVFASEATELEVTLPKLTVDAPPAPVIVRFTGNTVVLQTVAGCEYSSDGENWQSSATFTRLNEHIKLPTFYQRYKETDTAYASPVSKLDPPELLIGDFNDDGYINSDDLTELARIIAQIRGASAYEKQVGDLNDDGYINSDDLTLLAQFIAGIIAVFPATEI